MFVGMLSNLVSYKLSTTARWTENGITVAGFSNGASGSSLDGLWGNFAVYCTDNDILCIADTKNDRVVLVAPNSTTAIFVIGKQSSANMFTFSEPADVFVTETSMYVMDTLNFRVQKWSKNFSDPVTVAGISGIIGDSTNMMAIGYSYNLFVDSYGSLFVGDYGNNRVMMFPWNSRSGTSGVMIAGRGVQGAHASHLDGPSGVFVTDDRSLYIADTNNHRIQKWTIGSTYGVPVAGTGVAGSGLSQLYWPYTVLVDLNGYMYITDYGNNRIVRWAPDVTVGECIAACSGDWGIGSNQLNSPSYIAFDSRGSLYVNDFGNNRVQKFELLNNTSTVYQLNNSNSYVFCVSCRSKCTNGTKHHHSNTNGFKK